MVKEILFQPRSGWLPLFLCIVGLVGGVVIFGMGPNAVEIIWAVGGVVGGTMLFLVSLVCLFGLMAVPPNQARVLLLFGDYRGSVKASGVWA